MIYEDEQRRARRAIRLRAASRRLHLRDRQVSRGQPERARARPTPARHRALSERREDARLPPPDRSRGLSHRLSQLSPRSRSAGCARALAVRAGVGQSRILVERLSEPAILRQRATSRAAHQARSEPGLVRVPAGARHEAGRGRRFRGAACRQHGADDARCARRRAGAQQSDRHPRPAHPSRVPVRQERRDDPDRQPLVHVAAGRRGPVLAGLRAVHDRRGGERHPRPRPRIRRRHAPATIRFGGKEVANAQADAPPQAYLGLEQMAWFKERLRNRKRRGRSGAIRSAR